MEKSDIKTAVKTASNIVNDAYSSQEIFDILLEEIKETNDGKDWAITISFKRKVPEGISVPFTSIINNRIENKFKTIIIDQKSLEFKEMIHRQFNNE
ncbi:MAG: hypothetical protein WEA58_12325 [Balneolaceae bacterium]